MADICPWCGYDWLACPLVNVHLRLISASTWNCTGLVLGKRAELFMSRGSISRLSCPWLSIGCPAVSHTIVTVCWHGGLSIASWIYTRIHARIHASVDALIKSRLRPGVICIQIAARLSVVWWHLWPCPGFARVIEVTGIPSVSGVHRIIKFHFIVQGIMVSRSPRLQFAAIPTVDSTHGRCIAIITVWVEAACLVIRSLPSLCSLRVCLWTMSCIYASAIIRLELQRIMLECRDHWLEGRCG